MRETVVRHSSERWRCIPSSGNHKQCGIFTFNTNSRALSVGYNIFRCPCYSAFFFDIASEIAFILAAIEKHVFDQFGSKFVKFFPGKWECSTATMLLQISKFPGNLEISNLGETGNLELQNQITGIWNYTSPKSEL